MMLSRLRPTLLSATKVIFSKAKLAFSPLYSFAGQKKRTDMRIVEDLNKILTNEIKAQQEDKVQSKHFLAYFQNNNWQIQTYDALKQFTKKQGDYTVNVLAIVKSPPVPKEPQTQPQLKEEDQSEDDDVSQNLQVMMVVVRRQGADNMMVISVATSLEDRFEYSNVTFCDNYEQVKKGDLGLIIRANKYHGPSMDGLQQELVKQLGSFLEDDLGVNGQMFSNIRYYLEGVQKGYYIRWLKDFKQMLP